MIGALGAYIKTITALTIFSVLACMLMPEGSFRKYVELVLGVMILTAVLTPFLKLFGVEGDPLELHILRSELDVGTSAVTMSSYEEINQAWLEGAYGAELEKRVSADIGEKYQGVEWVSVAFCQDPSDEKYGEIQGITIGYGQENDEKIRKDIAKRYEINMDQVFVEN